MYSNVVTAIDKILRSYYVSTLLSTPAHFKFMLSLIAMAALIMITVVISTWAHKIGSKNIRNP